MTKRSLDLAKLIYEVEPDALAGDQRAVQRVSHALAKINGALLATTLLRHGDEALSDAVQKIAKAVELEARETASAMMLLEDDTGDAPSDKIN